MDIQKAVERLERSLLLLDRTSAWDVIFEVSSDTDPFETASALVSLTLERIGKDWEKGNLSLSQVYMSGVICEELIDQLLPPKSPTRIDQPNMGIAVLEDFHVLGKRIIFSVLRAGGFELEDLGHGISVNELVAKVSEKNIRVLLISVLMLPSALRVKELKEQLIESGVKIIVGGAPFRFDANLWKEVNADYCGHNPADAIRIVKQITSMS
ncbi:MAG: cobalamin B12-binding domain-containing protein [Bacteroidales bacterium]|nr:cobalamin B12-binding domain-containing protein [Bacteroidales bacterium]